MPPTDYAPSPQGRPDPKPIGLVLSEDDWLPLIDICEDRVKESQANSSDWYKKADRNKRMYYAGKDPAPLDDEICFNRIRTDIKTAVNQQTREPATIKLKPVETNDPGEFYSYDPAYTEPIDPQTAEMLMQPQPTGMVDQNGMEQMAPGMQLFKMDDKARADFWQRQFDFRFKPNLKHGHRGLWPSFRQCAFDAAIFGFKFPVFEWNIARKFPKLWTSISVWETHIDAIGVDHFEEAQFFGVDWLLDVGQAAQMFPEYEAQIRQYARDGNPPKGPNIKLGDEKDRRYDRNMIVVRHFWLRNQPILQTKDEVIESGVLPTEDVITGEQPDEMGMMQPMMETQLAPDPMTGVPPMPVISDEEGLSHNPEWPTKLVNRHVVYLPDIRKGLVDEECQYADIPGGWLPGDPIPQQLFGTGYPDSFNAAQMTENRIINAIVEYVETFPVPGASLPEDVAQSIEKGLKGHMLKPSDLLRIPSMYWEKYRGDVIKWNTPVALPAAVGEVMSILQQKTQETSVNADVSRGRLPGSGGGQATSGYALQLLMEQNASQFDFPAQWFNELIQRISGLLLDAMAKWLTTDDMMKVCSEYPAHIVEAFRRDALESDWNIEVTLSNVVGLQQARKRSDAIEARAQVSPLTGRPALSDRSLAEALELNFDHEQRQMDEEQQSPAAAQFQMAKMAEAQAKKNQPGSPKSNGNGQHAESGNGRF